jgi:hypothetical protein
LRWSSATVCLPFPRVASCGGTSGFLALGVAPTSSTDIAASASVAMVRDMWLRLRVEDMLGGEVMGADGVGHVLALRAWSALLGPSERRLAALAVALVVVVVGLVERSLVSSSIEVFFLAFKVDGNV